METLSDKDRFSTKAILAAGADSFRQQVIDTQALLAPKPAKTDNINWIKTRIKKLNGVIM